MKFQVSSLNTFWVMLRTKFKYNNSKNERSAITPTVWVMFLVYCTSIQWDLSACEFQVSSFNTFWVMFRTKFKNENEQRAITPKVWSFELWFLCTALLLNEIYLPLKFYVDALHSFKVMLRTKKGWTHGLTNGRTDGRTSQLLYATLWGHEKINQKR